MSLPFNSIRRSGRKDAQSKNSRNSKFLTAQDKPLINLMGPTRRKEQKTNLAFFVKRYLSHCPGRTWNQESGLLDIEP